MAVRDMCAFEPKPFKNKIKKANETWIVQRIWKITPEKNNANTTHRGRILDNISLVHPRNFTYLHGQNIELFTV